MSKTSILIASAFLVCMPVANAAPDDSALIAQLKQLATQGQDAQTTAQVNQYIDQNKGALSAILSSATNYLKQMQPAADADEAAPPANPPSQQPTETQTQTTEPTTALQTSTGTQASSGLQPSGGLSTATIQASSVQPSSGLQTGHLPGYPSLPAGDPITSVKVLTADQADYVIKVRTENYDRKAALMNSSAQ
jgi:hypothetical protein